MNPKPFFIVTMLFICATVKLDAQTAPDASQKTDNAKEKNMHQMNLIKINLTAIVLKNYSIQYERVLSKPVSLALSYRIMPTSKLPFANAISDAIGDDDPDAKKTIENLRMGNFAITPEARFYLGKGYGKGFYIALFYRYASLTINHMPVDYDNNNSLDLSGKLSSNTGGIMFGAQWNLGKHMCLDWWITGPHYGSGVGDFNGVSSQPLTPTQQNELRQNLEDLDIPLTTKTIQINANGASLKLDGPWGGVRAGILLGIKF